MFGHPSNVFLLNGSDAFDSDQIAPETNAQLQKQAKDTATFRVLLGTFSCVVLLILLAKLLVAKKKEQYIAKMKADFDKKHHTKIFLAGKSMHVFFGFTFF